VRAVETGVDQPLGAPAPQPAARRLPASAGKMSAGAEARDEAAPRGHRWNSPASVARLRGLAWDEGCARSPGLAPWATLCPAAFAASRCRALWSRARHERTRKDRRGQRREASRTPRRRRPKGEDPTPRADPTGTEKQRRDPGGFGIRRVWQRRDPGGFGHRWNSPASVARLRGLAWDQGCARSPGLAPWATLCPAAFAASHHRARRTVGPVGVGPSGSGLRSSAASRTVGVRSSVLGPRQPRDRRCQVFDLCSSCHPATFA
jgi:hypothetical protein